MTGDRAGLRRRIDEFVAGLPRPDEPDGVRGAVVRVEVPPAGFVHAAAAGIARADTGAAMTVDRRFHIASIGKMMTATLVLDAASAGRFGPAGIDTPLGEIAVAPAALVTGLHPDGASITLRHLLGHTSGLKDMQVDDASGTAAELGGPAPDSVLAHFAPSAARIADGDDRDGFARHRWVPWDPSRPDDPMAGMLNRYLATGTGRHPVGAPGERFHYSDSAYVLLGVLVEAATGRPYAQLQQEQILRPLGLADTYLAYHDDPSPTARADEMDMWLGAVPLLSAGLDVSLDWGGGGQVSTVADLCRFLRGLLGGELHDADVTAARQEWAEPVGLRDPFLGIGLGLLRWTSGGRSVVGHAGAWGGQAFHDPVTGAFVAGTVGGHADAGWLAPVFDAIEDELGPAPPR